VVAFRLSGVAITAERWWVIVADGDVDICDQDPGFDVAATVVAGLRDLICVWRGDQSWNDACAAGTIQIVGPSGVRRHVPSWIGQGQMAAVPRPAPVGRS
jgi:hypothetical protein